jgi:hypothetical protein
MLGSYRERQKNGVDQVQNKVAKFAHQRNFLSWKPWHIAEGKLVYVFSSKHT